MANQRFIVLTFLGIAFVAGLTFHSAAIQAILVMGRADTMIAGLLPVSSLIGVGAAILTFFILFRSPAAVRYTDEAIGELVKVTWPDREETINSSLIVIVSSLIFSGSLAVFDFVWAEITSIFLFTAS
ncbi:MAG: preprotein translocase subunit SecE [Alphaproteobacteria bacterium]|nr:preprotein translocase subunit SecE [Alphaproteobacteria bacterium]